MNDIYNHKIPARNPRTGIFLQKTKNKNIAHTERKVCMRRKELWDDVF